MLIKVICDKIIGHGEIMKRVLLYLNSLLKENDTIIVATSGGPDSMCLLHLMCELKSKLNLKIIVAHVNHKLRAESEEEALFVKEVSDKYNLIYEYMEILEYNDDNLENDARTKRYEFFNKLVKKYHANYLMTAHHGDDLMETILMRLTRGSSLKGYSGFKKEFAYEDYTIVRPLITETKKDIQNYMDEHGYKYYIDQSNFSENYTRNRYRMKVLPFLKNEDPLVHRKFLKFSEELTDVNNFLEKYIENLINEISDEEGIKVTELRKLDKFLLKKVIEYTLTKIYIDDLFLINDKHTNLIIGMIRSDKSNNQVNLPNNYRAVKSYNNYNIVKENKENEYEYILEDKIILPNNKIIKKVEKKEGKSNYILRLNSKDIELPIKVRSRQNGDRISVKNLKGTKKVKDIYIDEKIPVEKRREIPIVTDSNDTILWLPGVKKSKFDVESNGIYDIILSYEEE